jgi:hypothetical protein
MHSSNKIYCVVVSSSVENPTHSCSVLKELPKARTRLVLLIPTGGLVHLYTRLHENVAWLLHLSFVEHIETQLIVI